jgi:hypothetical protein
LIYGRIKKDGLKKIDIRQNQKDGLSLKKLIMTILIICALGVQASADDNSSIPQSVTLNGVDITSEVPKIMMFTKQVSDNVYFVPIMNYCEKAGIPCEYKAGVGTMYFEDKSVEYGAVYINGYTEDLDSSARGYGFIENGLVMAPENFLSRFTISQLSSPYGSEEWNLSIKTRETPSKPLRIEIVSKAFFDEAFSSPSPIAYSKNGNKSYDWLVKPTYDAIGDFNEGYSLAINIVNDEETKRKLYKGMGVDYDSLVVETASFVESYAISSSGQVMNLDYKPIDAYSGYSEGLIKFVIFKDVRETYYNFMDMSGKRLSDVEYADLEPFKDGLAKALGVLGGNKFHIGYLDHNGNLAIDCEALGYYQYFSFSEGLARVTYSSEGTGRTFYENSYIQSMQSNALYGYINKDGSVAIKPQFKEAGDFHGGCAKVILGTDNRYALINTKGEVLTAENLSSMQDLSDGLARAKLDRETLYYDNAGRVVLKPDMKIPGHMEKSNKDYVFNDFHDGLASFYDYDRTVLGSIDKNGNVVFYKPFSDGSESWDYSEGLRVYRSRSKYGYLDKTGEVAIEAQFDFVNNFKGGFAVVEVNGKKGIIKNPISNQHQATPQATPETTPQATPEAAPKPKLTVMVNGAPLIGDADSYINENNRAMAPLRAVADAFGFEVEWDPETRKIILNNANVGITTEMHVGDPNFTINGQAAIFEDAVPTIKEERTFLPLRKLAEILGVDVQWDESTMTASFSN